MRNNEVGGGASQGNGNGTAPQLTGSALAQARTAALVVDVQTKRLALEQRRGALISRDRAVLKAFAFARVLRDRWLAWPARIGPQIAAAFDLDAGAMTVVLEGYVQDECDCHAFLADGRGATSSIVNMRWSLADVRACRFAGGQLARPSDQRHEVESACVPSCLSGLIARKHFDPRPGVAPGTRGARRDSARSHAA